VFEWEMFRPNLQLSPFCCRAILRHISNQCAFFQAKNTKGDESDDEWVDIPDDGSNIDISDSEESGDDDDEAESEDVEEEDDEEEEEKEDPNKRQRKVLSVELSSFLLVFYRGGR